MQQLNILLNKFTLEELAYYIARYILLVTHRDNIIQIVTKIEKKIFFSGAMRLFAEEAFTRLSKSSPQLR